MWLKSNLAKSCPRKATFSSARRLAMSARSTAGTSRHPWQMGLAFGLHPML
jgi:hypothetical protein